MRYLLFFLGLTAFGATGDVSAVRVIAATCTAGSICNGWVAEVDITKGTPNTGGTYAMGMGSYNDPANAKVVFTVTSPGYDETASTTTFTRIVWGTFQLRKPYPNQTVMDETDNSTYVTVRVALSAPIFVSDTATVSIASGFYTVGGTPNNAISGLSVTVNSTLAYQKPVANWTCTSRSLAGATLAVSAFGMAGMAAGGAPLAAVIFTATDASGNSASATVATMTKTTGMALDFGHYVATLDTSGFHNGDLITVNFKAYPRIGQSGAVFDTNDNAAAGENTWKAAPIFFISDISGTYGRSYAFVDPVNGSDTTCAANTNATTARTTTCLTIGWAERKVRDYNNTTFGRQNLANSVIYLQNGTYDSIGNSNLTYSSTGDTVIWTLTKAPEATRSSVIIRTNSNTAYRYLTGLYIRVTDVTLARDADRYLFSPTPTGSSLLIDNCQITDNAAYTVTNLVNTTFGRLEARQNTYTDLSYASGYWFIGNSVSAPKYLGYARTMIGNLADAPGTGHGGAIISESSNCTATSDGAIIYNNKFYNSQDQIVALAGTCNWTNGLVIANNLWESNYVTGGGPAVGISSDGSTTTTNNVVFVHNTIAGNRCNLAYNDYGTTATPQTNWIISYNLFEYFANKNDLFTSPSGGQNGNRVGGWPIAMGVTSWGNSAIRGSFAQEFLGVLSLTGTDASQIPPLFVNDQSGHVSGTGTGDYHLTAGAPGIGRVLAGASMLPYDIDGVARKNDGTGAAGAYEYGSTRRRNPVVTQ